MHHAPGRIQDRAEPDVVGGDAHQVGERPCGDLAEPAAEADRPGAVRRRHAQGRGRGNRAGIAVVDGLQQHLLAHLAEHVGHLVHAEPHVHARRHQVEHAGEPLGELHVVARAVHHVGAGSRQQVDLGVGEQHAVHQRHVGAAEPQPVEELDGPAAVLGPDGPDLRRRLGHVRVEPQAVRVGELAGRDVVVGRGLAERDRCQHDALGGHAGSQQRADAVESGGERLGDGVVTPRHQASGQVPADAGGLVPGDGGLVEPVAMERVHVVHDRRDARGQEPGGAVGRHRLVLHRPGDLVQPPVEAQHLVQLQALAGAQPRRHVPQVVVEVD